LKESWEDEEEGMNSYYVTLRRRDIAGIERESTSSHCLQNSEKVYGPVV
jgi:hypothetical protein